MVRVVTIIQTKEQNARMAPTAGSANQKVVESENNVLAACRTCAQLRNVAMDQSIVARKVVKNQNMVVIVLALRECQKSNPQVNLWSGEGNKRRGAAKSTDSHETLAVG